MHPKHPSRGINQDAEAVDLDASLNSLRDGTVVAVDGRLVDVLGELFRAVDDIRTQLAGKRKSHYTTEEFAVATGRAPYTIRTWIKDGRVKALRVPGTGPKGRLLIPHEELAKLVSTGRAGSVPAAVID